MIKYIKINKSNNKIKKLFNNKRIKKASNNVIS